VHEASSVRLGAERRRFRLRNAPSGGAGELQVDGSGWASASPADAEDGRVRIGVVSDTHLPRFGRRLPRALVDGLRDE